MPSLGLSMIVKNASETLAYCLQSVSGIMDQIVIADTGSTDDTVRIAEEFGATILHVPWTNHFADARNAALAPMTTDWILVLDADEELDQDAKASLPAMLNTPGVGGYVVPIRNYVRTRFNRGWDRMSVPNDGRHDRAKSAASFFVHENCRLFRRDPQIVFSGRVHELVEPQIKKLGLQLKTAGFCIHHFGQLADEQKKADKANFYRNLMRQKTEEEPGDASTWILYGLHEYDMFQNAEEALRAFQRAVEITPRAAPAWLFTAMIHVDFGRYEEALRALQLAGSDPQSKVLRESLRGDALHNLGRFKEARISYQQALAAGNNPMLESKLGYTEVRMGLKKMGFAKLQRARDAMPGMFDVHNRLLKAYVAADQLQAAAQEADRFATTVAHPRLFLRAASLHAQLQQWEQGREMLAQGLQKFPGSPELLHALQELNATAAATIA